MKPRSLLEKLWEAHAVRERGNETLLFIDRHFFHEGGLRGFEMLRERGLAVAMPERTLGIADHFVPTDPARLATLGERQRTILSMLEQQAAERGIAMIGIDDPRQGIVHVVAPELGLTLPGMTVVCGDSHTASQGALGSLAFGIGATELAKVFAAQALWLRRPKAMLVRIEGALAAGVTAKDVALAVVARIGAGGGAGHVIEYGGSTVRAMGVEARLTLCNMAIEAGARSGLVNPDAVTIDWLRGRAGAPQGEDFETAARDWLDFASDPDAHYDRTVEIDAAAITPMSSWGTSPEEATPIAGTTPPVTAGDHGGALGYMGLAPGQALAGLPVDEVFIGSCTNSRIDDLRLAASILRDRHVAAGVKVTVVPGSMAVRRQAEAEGLDRIFVAAGCDWRLPGCSMCVGMNGDIAPPGARVASTSNRNYPGRQGPDVRTHLMSPASAAATALEGRIADPRPYLASAGG